MKIDWGQIVTHAISTLVAIICVGAGMMVWNKADSIAVKTEVALAGVKATQESLAWEVGNLSDRTLLTENNIATQKERLDRAIGSLYSSKSSVSSVKKPVVEAFMEDKPQPDGPLGFDQKAPVPKQSEEKRIYEDIRTRQQQIQQNDSYAK